MGFLSGLLKRGGLAGLLGGAVGLVRKREKPTAAPDDLRAAMGQPQTTAGSLSGGFGMLRGGPTEGGPLTPFQPTIAPKGDFGPGLRVGPMQGLGGAITPMMQPPRGALGGGTARKGFGRLIRGGGLAGLMARASGFR